MRNQKVSLQDLPENSLPPSLPFKTVVPVLKTTGIFFLKSILGRTGRKGGKRIVNMKA